MAVCAHNWDDSSGQPCPLCARANGETTSLRGATPSAPRRARATPPASGGGDTPLTSPSVTAEESSTPLAGGWPAPRATVATGSYSKVTSFIIVSQRARVKVTGTLDAHRMAYKAAQLHTSLAGWWGIPFGLYWTPMSLTSNRKMFKSIEQLLATGTPKAAWMKDPSGKFDERFWDGQRWTDRVRSATSDTATP